MSSVRLAEVLAQRTTTEYIADTANETFVTLKLRGGGAVKRSIGEGKTPRPFRGYRVRANDFIYSRIDARNGALALVPAELDRAVVSKDFPSFAIDVSRIDVRYLHWITTAPQFASRIQQLSFGATNRQRVDEASFLRLTIPLPPLPEQRRIAAILDEADALRAKRREWLMAVRDVERAMYERATADCAERVCVGDVATRVTDGTHQAPQWAPEGVPFLFVSNIVGGEIDYSTNKFVSESTHAALTKRAPIEQGDVLYSAVGSYGVPVVVERDEKFLFQRHIAHIKTDRNRVEPHFLRAALASVDAQRQADRVARGVAQKTVTLASLAKITIPRLGLARQREFVIQSNAVRTQIVAAKRQLGELDSLFSSLQYRAFRGEL